MRNISIKEISKIISVDYQGKDFTIDSLNLCNRFSKFNSILSYVTSIKYKKYLKNKPQIKALLVVSEIYEQIRDDFPDICYLVVQNPEDVFYFLHTYLFRNTDFYDHFNFEKIVGQNCEIHETAWIDNGVIVGDNVKIGSHSCLNKGCIIGDNSTIGCCSIIGSEGFQLIKDKNNNNVLIKHVGGCKLGTNVSIGDNVTVCKSLFEDYTTIGSNTKIDNLVHIAHNCSIGDNCVLTAGVILCGTTIIEDHVWVAPNSTISNKVVLEEKSFVGLGSVVIKKVKAGTKVFGIPAKEI